MEFKQDNEYSEKEYNYFSNEKDFMNKDDVIKSIDNDLGGVEDKTNKIHSMSISFDKSSQNELLKGITNKEVDSINELSKNEKVDYERAMQGHVKDIMKDYNVENKDRPLDFYGKVSYDKGYSNSTEVDVVLVDKNERGINQEGMKEIINNKYENEIGVNSHTGIEKNNQYDYNKLVYDKENIPQDTQANKDLYKLKSYLDDKSPRAQDTLLNNYSKLNEEQTKAYLDKMEKQRMNRDYLSILKEDMNDFEEGIGFNDNTVSYEDFQKDWKQSFEEEKGIVQEVKDLGLGM